MDAGEFLDGPYTVSFASETPASRTPESTPMDWNYVIRMWGKRIAEEEQHDSNNPYSCSCKSCREWVIDVEADRAYDSARED